MPEEKPETPKRQRREVPVREVDETGRYIDGPHPEDAEDEEPEPKNEDRRD